MRGKTTIFFQSLKGDIMKKGKCSVCGQEMFDPLLSEINEADSRIEELANDILHDVLDFESSCYSIYSYLLLITNLAF